MKKKQYSKQLALLLSTLAVIGTVHAEDSVVEVDGTREGNKLIIQRLVERGVIVRLDQENWYEINHQRLNEIANEEIALADRQVQQENVVKMLKELIGKDVDIKQVHILGATLSSQDYAGMAK